MLRNSFILLSGVGEKTERSIWRAGVNDWQTFQSAAPDRLPGRAARHHERHADQLALAEEHLSDGDTAPFVRWLPNNETWRLLDELGERALYLDIETTGLTYPDGRTTVVGYHMPSEGTELLVRGKDLHAGTIQDALDRASCVVTFNGRRFDIPFLEREFGVEADGLPHVDLMYTFRKLGMQGGLKSIERQLGLARDDEVDGMGGYMAVKLWRRYEHGDRSALETLLTYNRADVENMVPLAQIAYDRLRARTFGAVDVPAGRPGQTRLSETR